MATTAEGRSSRLDAVETVVDCDFHIIENQEDFIPYIPEPYHSFLFDAVDDAAELGSFYPRQGIFSNVTTGRVSHERTASRELVAAAMDDLGLDVAICSSSTNLYLSCVAYDDLAVALATAWNDWALDNVADPDNGIYIPVLIATQKPDKAAEEIDARKDEPGVAAVGLPDGGVSPPLGNERYHPIYEAAEDAGLPVLMHAASGNSMMSFPLQFQGFNQMIANHAVSHTMTKMCHVASLIFEGVPVRFPDLELVIQEAGIGWYPYFMRRLDHEFRAERWQAPLLDRMPSEYLREQFYLTSQPIEGTDDPAYVQQIVRLFDGQDSLMFSTDYPHFDFDYPDQLYRVLAGAFSDEELSNIYGGTALELFDL